MANIIFAMPKSLWKTKRILFFWKINWNEIVLAPETPTLVWCYHLCYLSQKNNEMVSNVKNDASKVLSVKKYMQNVFCHCMKDPFAFQHAVVISYLLWLLYIFFLKKNLLQRWHIYKNLSQFLNFTNPKSFCCLRCIKYQWLHLKRL